MRGINRLTRSQQEDRERVAMNRTNSRPTRIAQTASHWGVYQVETDTATHEVVSTAGVPFDPHPSPIRASLPASVHDRPSQLDQAPLSRGAKVAGREPILLSAADAHQRGLKDGDVVRVFNDRSAFMAGVMIAGPDTLLPGVALMATGAWMDDCDDTVYTRGSATRTLFTPSTRCGVGHLQGHAPPPSTSTGTVTRTSYTLMSPVAGQSGTIMLSAWGHQLSVDTESGSPSSSRPNHRSAGLSATSTCDSAWEWLSGCRSPRAEGRYRIRVGGGIIFHSNVADEFTVS
ncbi:molybdopterin dinucleotide binding domain-containing protein [Streptomyces hawaiiensis]|uniref:molybdopterin dinucleotide binding domain-containing protein n=1 Tax=Streptomyces hawaiiensis TaxID=67305 RepID=UPI003652F01D